MSFVIDTSILVAIVLLEPEAESLGTQLAHARGVCMSAVSVFEANLVMLNKQGASGVAQISELVQKFKLKIVAFDEKQSLLATEAAAAYGKGRHPASLNFGDCCAYALAKSLDLPLLFKGNDFSQTDLRAVV